MIEVLATLVLLSTLLVGALLASVRHGEQIRQSHLRREMTRLADKMLFAWFQEPNGIPRQRRGEIEGYDNIFWQTRPVRGRQHPKLGIEVVRFEIVDKLKDRHPVIVSVELVVPARSWPEQSEATAPSE